MKKSSSLPQPARGKMRLEQLEPRLLLNGQSVLAAGAISANFDTEDLNSLTATQLAQSLVGAGIQISNATFTGALDSAGAFIGGLSQGLSIESGVILSSGDIADAEGPNNSDSKGSNQGQSGDTALNGLIPGYTTQDAAILEFDFVPVTSTLSFQYIFASEEYNEYAGSSYNDVFGFFVNGQNIALIPGTTSAVAINNLNKTSHAQYFRDNDYGDFSPNIPYPIQYDGFTTALQAVANVTAGQSTHIKLAIADVGDGIYDSAVFLAGGSFVSSLADVSVSKIASDSTIEVNETVTFTLTAANNSTDTTATGVVVSDILPAGMSFLSANASQGTISIAGNTVSVSVGNMTPGQTVSISVTAKATAEGDLVNQALISSNEYDPVSSNNTDSLTVAVSATAPDGGIAGTVWNDTDGDGNWDGSEAGLAGVVVYLDINNSGTLNSSEPFAISSADNILTAGVDESGTFYFSGLATGNYTVRQILPGGYLETHSPGSVPVTAGQTTQDADIGDQPVGVSGTTISGTKFKDLNMNGIRDGGLIQGTNPDAVFVIDVSGSTTNGFQGTPVGDQNGDSKSDTVLDAEIAGFIALNQQLITLGYGDTAKVSIVSFASSASQLDMDPVTAGTQLYTTPNADLDNNGVRDVEQALKALTSTGSTNYEAALSTAKTTVDTVGTTSGNGNVIFLSDGEPNNMNFEDEVNALHATGVNVRAFGVGSGAVLAPLQVIDSQAAIFTTTNELLQVFGGSGGGGGTTTYTEDPIGGVTIYLDLNDNGVLDANEPSTLTAADGSYSFTGLTPGATYVVREILPSGYLQTSGPFIVTLGTNPSVNLDFGNVPASLTAEPDSISGYKFNDLNGNGIRESREPGLENWEIFLDENGNGELDFGEEYTLTDEFGYYEFTELDPGDYIIAEVVQTADWYQTYPGSPNFPAGHSVTLASGQAITGLLFGNHEKLPTNVSTDVISGVKFDDANGNGIRDGGLIQGTNPDAIFVIDVSGSTAYSFQGTPVGDLNGDGKSDSVLDAEIAGFIALNNQLITLGFGGTARVSIVAFGSSATQIDMDPLAAGIQLSTSPEADADSNGVNDVEQALRGLGSSGGTNYEAALSSAKDIYQTVGTTTGNGNVIFLSDGEPNNLNFADEVSDLVSTGVNVKAFGVGSGAKLPPLQMIDAGATIFTTTNELLNVFSGSTGSGTGGTTTYTENGLGGVTIYLDLNDNGVFDTGEPFTITATDGSYSFSGLTQYDTYTVREVVPTDYVQTAPQATYFTVEVGTDQTLNLDFGNVAAPADKPDLVAKSLTLSPSGTLVPGDKMSLSFVVANEGTVEANGPVNVYFYASADGVLDAGDTEIGSILNKNVKLAVGAEASPFVLKNYVIASDTLPGAVTYFAVVAAADASIDESSTSNNEASTGAQVKWRYGSWDDDGDGVLDRTNVKLTVADADGTDCTFSMSGDGYGELDGPAFQSLDIYNTTGGSKTTVKTSGGATPGTAIDDVHVHGTMGEIKASTVNLENSLQVDEVIGNVLMAQAVATGKQIPIQIGTAATQPSGGVDISFHQIKNVNIDSDSPLGSVTCAEWLDDGAADDIHAPSAYKIESKGDKKNAIAGNFEADVYLSDASSLVTGFTVNGLLNGVTFQTAGSIKAAKLVAVQDSDIFAGATAGTLPTSTAQLTNPAAGITSLKMGGKETIGTLTGTANNHSFSNTRICSGSLGSISLIGVERANGGVEFGLAGSSIKAVKVKQPDGKGYSFSNGAWKSVPDTGWGDFIVRLLT
ncbi:MAG: choice-of-anchor L domain-containing protein [Sedimentisphaerales bacterium]|nr:choice-of-anchor L domain-containing protein [Sedimentisphaerales bacterium]